MLFFEELESLSVEGLWIENDKKQKASYITND